MARFLMGAPRRQRRSVERYSIVKSLRALAKRYGVNPKTVAKWRSRKSVADLRTGPKEPRSTVLTVEEEAVVVAFRRHTHRSMVRRRGKSRVARAGTYSIELQAAGGIGTSRWTWAAM